MPHLLIKMSVGKKVQHIILSFNVKIFLFKFALGSSHRSAGPACYYYVAEVLIP